MPDPLLAVALALMLTASVLGIAAVILLWRLTVTLQRIESQAELAMWRAAYPDVPVAVLRSWQTESHDAQAGVGWVGNSPAAAGRDHSEVRLADGDLLGRRERDSE